MYVHTNSAALEDEGVDQTHMGTETNRTSARGHLAFCSK